jgi:hypothetical protein
MKKLLFFLSFIVTCYIGQSQAIVTLKGGQFGVSSLLPVGAFTLLGNPTGSIAVPQAFPIGYELRFNLGKLEVDSTIKDTIFAVNGLQIIGAGFRTIGLGGFLSQNTTVSGSNLYDLTIDSMQANVLHGFRVNFGGDAPYDMFYRDSATGRWTNFHKGSPGQVVTMLSTGGIGWAPNGGAGYTANNGLTLAGSVLQLGGNIIQATTINLQTTQSLTIDNAVAGTSKGFRVNFGSDAGYDMFYRDSATGFWKNFGKGTPGQAVIMLPGGGIGWGTVGGGGGGGTLTRINITSGVSSTSTTNTLVKFNFTLTMVANAGQTLYFNSSMLLNAGSDLRFRYNAVGTYWDQVYAH